MIGNFSENFINYTATLCVYISDGGCKKHATELVNQMWNGNGEARTHLFEITFKTMGAAYLAGIISGIVGWKVILVPLSSAFIFVDGVYRTDNGRKLIDISINHFDNFTSTIHKMFRNK